VALPHDPPWRLDPLKNIIGVGWGGGLILALEFSFTFNGPRPEFRIENLNFANVSYDMFQAGVRERATGVTVSAPPVVDPISKEMLERLIIWNKGPKTTELSADFQTTGRALWFFNIGKIAAQVLELQKPNAKFTIRIPKANGQHAQGTSVQYYVFPTFIDWIPPDGGPSSGFIAGIFSTLAEAQALVDVLNVHSSYRVVTEVGAQSFVDDRLSWTMRATLYRGKKSFPVNPATNEPAWPFTFGPGNAIIDGQTRTGSGPQPARSLVITVNTKTARVTADLL
jgi:hypothetical protein